MRVAIVSHAYQEERYLAALDTMARLPGVQVSLIHPRTYKGAAYRWKRSHSVQDLPVPVIFGSRQGAFLYRPFAFAEALDRADPDVIVHEQEAYALASAQIAVSARGRRIPLVQFVWENVDRALALPRRALLRFVLARVSAVIAGSEKARQIHERWGFRGCIEKTPQMGVTVRRDSSLRNRRSEIFKVCFVGRLTPCKGVDCLVRAVEALYRRGIAISCVIVGDGGERTKLERLAKELGIWTQVHFRGRLSEDRVRDLLQSSDALVLPSRRTPAWEEQFGLVLAEAMAEGTVTVGSRTGAISEVIGMGELLFDEDDVDGLTSILERLARDSAFLIGCRRALWRRASDLFSADRIAAQKLKFLQRVLRSAIAADRDPVVVDEELRVREG
jgi:glycosyltransferase involved in cell wall biosynthesis